MKQFTDFLNTSLNTQQKKAVTASDGVFLVVAGAGSGKTRVITARIANLILQQDATPADIIALTFTNKAGNEMKERVKQFLPDGYPVPFVGTFHSYCLRLLKEHNKLLEKPFVSILDEDDKQKLLSDIIKRNGLGKQTTAKKVAYSISRIKNSLIGTDMERSGEYQFALPLVKEIFATYEQEKKASKCFDFDDLLCETVCLFEKNKQFKKEFQKNVSHFLVDEYQDTNVVQHELLKHMTKNGNKTTAQSICVVGDEDQSIYSWRGATVSNIINFKKDFPGTKTIKIEQNYRSVQPILDVANHVIKNNVNRNEKKLWTDKKARDRIRVVTCMSEYQEGDAVAQFLQTAEKKQSLQSIAILYRAHYQSRSIEEALVRNTIPYKIIGGTQFYERKEIKDLLAYLRLVINPFDRASFFRVINCPARGLGAKFEELFYERWSTESLFNFADVAKDILRDKILTRGKQEALTNFLKIFENCDHTTKPSVALDQIISSATYLTYLKNAYDQQEAQARIENVKELIRAVKYLEQQGTKTIGQFLDEVALMQDSLQKNSEEENVVSLMTLHAAKGLEFDTVILVGMEDGLLPSSRSFVDSDAIEEERRLFYVGVTRAQERLLLTHCKYRYTYGQMTIQRPSRFLAELPVAQFQHHDCSSDKVYHIESLFARWLGVQKQNDTSKVFTFGLAKKPKISKNPNKKYPSKKPIFGKTTTKEKKSFSFGGYKKNQPVKHQKFGIGLVQKVEKKADRIYLSVKFNCGTKKLDAKFVKRI